MQRRPRVKGSQGFLPVCCRTTFWEVMPKSILPLVICCSRGTSTEVSHERDCKSPGKSSSLRREGSEPNSLRRNNFVGFVAVLPWPASLKVRQPTWAGSPCSGYVFIPVAFPLRCTGLSCVGKKAKTRGRSSFHIMQRKMVFCTFLLS